LTHAADVVVQGAANSQPADEWKYDISIHILATSAFFAQWPGNPSHRVTIMIMSGNSFSRTPRR
jgi:hypothetical protein